MEIWGCLMVIFGYGQLLIAVNAVPIKIINNDIESNGVSEIGDDNTQIINDAEGGSDDDDDDDDLTTHGFERLSSAATCLVAGVEYTHGQQIYRTDQCEFCLCLDGEMFCWWQDCPPTLDGPCRDRGPFTPCQDAPVSPSIMPPQSTTIKTEYSSTSPSSLSPSVETATNENFTDSSSPDDLDDLEISTDSIPSSSSSSSSSTAMVLTTVAKYCVIMGRKYQIGDKLPHDTGNCVECICGNGAKVTCSPHQCTPIDGDINDYHPPGQRQQTPDVF